MRARLCVHMRVDACVWSHKDNEAVPVLARGGGERWVILVKGWVGTLMGTAEASTPACWCAFCVCLSVCQSAALQYACKTQDGSNLEIGSAANKAQLQRAEAGWERSLRRTEARAGDIHLNLEGGGEM